MEILRVQEVTKSAGKKKILDSVSFIVEKGEILGLVGRSGVGKSVLIKTLIGFYKPEKGFVAINSGSKNPIGYSMQDNALYDNLTVKQNLIYFSEIHNVPSKIWKYRIPTLIEKLNLREYEKILVKNLSGGTKKRADIACALLTDPEVLVLDEPYLGLDPVLTNELSEFILSLSRMGKTVIVSSHDLNEMRRTATRVVLLKGAKLYKIDRNHLEGIYT